LRPRLDFLHSTRFVNDRGVDPFPPTPMPAEQQDVLDVIADLIDRLDRAEAELLAAQEREKVAYAQILYALDPNRGGYSRQALDRLRRFARQASGLSDEQAAALAGSPSEKLGSEEEACPRCGATPDGGTSLDCPMCTGVVPWPGSEEKA